MPEIPAQPYPIPVVRALIENSEGRILLLRRAATAYGQGQWCLPGGKIDYGRTVEAALAQEIREETSLQLLGAEFLFFQNSLPLHPGGMHCINFYFHCRVSGDLQLNAESSEYAWIGPAETSNYNIVFRNDEAIRRYWQNRG
jgi:8-oxo-dGTP pyrophosphatase MutT (NUDIX family)